MKAYLYVHLHQPLHATMPQAFAENILLCGGGSGFPHLGTKFVTELQSVSPPSLQPAMCSCPDYMPEHTLKYSSWMGAAILSKVCQSRTECQEHMCALLWQLKAAKIVTTCFEPKSCGTWRKYANGSQWYCMHQTCSTLNSLLASFAGT